MKRVLCIHDLCCVGRCSLSVILPVLSAMGIEACALPTTVLSSHTGGFGTPAFLPTDAFCEAALDHFAAEGIVFDAVYSGYLANEAQAALVERAYTQNPAALKLADPVLGDGGKLYHGLSPRLCAAQQALCRKADVITPNETEAALLLDLSARDNPPSPALCGASARLSASAARQTAALLHSAYAVDVVLTGRANVWCTNSGSGLVLSEHTGVAFPGTGDLFAAVLLGALLCGKPLRAATELAASFTARAARATAPKQARFGVNFEPLLAQLAKETELL